jgi:AcrR family transcriptional regulator
MSRPARRPYTPRMTVPARREQLLDAALQIIARDGYRGLSIEAIAREADVTRPVVYNVFDGLEDLLYTLLDRQERRALDQLTTTVQLEFDSDDLDAVVLRAVRALIDTVSGDPLTWRPIFLAPEGTPGPVRERIARDRELVRQQLKSVLEFGLERRGGPQGVDTEVLSHAMIAIGEYFGRLLLEPPAELDAERLTASVAHLLALLGP